MARPRKELSPDQVKQIEHLGSVGATNEEIAAVMEISADTLERRFAGAIKKGKLKGRVSLRRTLYAKALGQKRIDGSWLEKPDLGALVWLSKQELGMKERSEFTDTTKEAEVKVMLDHFKKLVGG